MLSFVLTFSFAWVASTLALTLDEVGCSGLFDAGSTSCLISQPTLVTSSSIGIKGTVSLVGSSTNSVLQLTSSTPLLVLAGASLSISNATVNATSFQLSPPEPVNDLNLRGIQLQLGGQVSIANSTILLDCTTWATMFDTICDTGYAPGNCKVSDPHGMQPACRHAKLGLHARAGSDARHGSHSKSHALINGICTCQC